MGEDWSSHDDASLVRRTVAGRLDSFEALVARYEKKIYNLSLRYALDPQEAEDLTQETFVRAFRALASFRGDARFSTWLYRVATNVCLDAARRRKHRPEPILDRPIETAEGEMERDVPSDDPSPAAQVEQQERAAVVRREIAALPEPYRTVLILRDLQDFSYEEIAASLHVSPGTVKSRLHRARARLRERFEALELFSSLRVEKSEPMRTVEGGEAP